MSKAARVRFADRKDVPALMELGRLYVAERGMTFNPRSAELALYDMLSSEDQRIFIAESDEKPVGVAVVYFENTFHVEKIGHVGILFVLPEHRGTGVGRELAKVAATWFDMTDCETAYAAVAGRVGEDQIYINTIRKAGFKPSQIILERSHGLS